MKSSAYCSELPIRFLGSNMKQIKICKNSKIWLRRLDFWLYFSSNWDIKLIFNYMCEINIFSKDMDWLAKQYHFHVYNWEYSQYCQCFSTELTILLSLSFELYIVPGTTNCRFKIISVSFFPFFHTNEYYHRRTVCFHFKIYSFHSCQQYTKNITAIITITTSAITTSKK